jgi:hypothetical protein
MLLDQQMSVKPITSIIRVWNVFRKRIQACPEVLKTALKLVATTLPDYCSISQGMLIALMILCILEAMQALFSWTGALGRWRF